MFGLQVGDRIESAVNNATAAALRRSEVQRHQGPRYPGDERYVYVTTDMALARAFAALLRDPKTSRHGDLYEVKPDGQLLTDPDFAPTSQTCPSAIILAVQETNVQLSPVEIRMAKAKYMRWECKTHVYDAAGNLNAAKWMRAKGWTKQDLLEFGPYADHEFVDRQIRHGRRPRKLTLTPIGS